jgi:hypothetical protein
MKHLTAVAAACLALACSSGNHAKIIQPELEFVQLVGPAELNYQQGQIEIQYGLRIANRSSEPITLHQIQLASVGAGGPYQLRRETYFFSREVPPGQFADVTFWAKAISTGDFASLDANAPVTIRGTAIFRSPAGDFRQVFVKILNQMGGSSRPQ